MKKPDGFELTLMLSGILIPVMNLRYQVGTYSVTIIEIMTLILAAAFLLQIRPSYRGLSIKGQDKLFLALIF